MAGILTQEQLNNIISDYLAKLKTNVSIDEAILYGSYAKGTAKEFSDIDLFIISKDLPPNEPKCKNGYFLDNLVGNFNPRLEVFAINPKQLNNPYEKDFFNEIKKTGKKIDI